MRSVSLLCMVFLLSLAGCESAPPPPEREAIAFESMTPQQGGLVKHGANSCPLVPDAPEVIEAINKLPGPKKTNPSLSGKWVGSYDGRYDRCGDLTAVVVEEEEDNPLKTRQVLFFHQGNFVGTADPCGFGPTEIKSARKDVVVVQYRWPRTGETEDTMSGFANIKYRWDGKGVIRLNAIPEELYLFSECQP